MFLNKFGKKCLNVLNNNFPATNAIETLMSITNITKTFFKILPNQLCMELQYQIFAQYFFLPPNP